MTPVVSETSVLLGLSHSLEILTHDGIDLIGNKLGVSTIPGVSLSVEEPLGDIVIGGSSNDVRDVLDLFFGHLTSSLVDVDGGLLESEDGESSTNTLDLTEAEWSLLRTIKIGVLETQNTFEIVGVLDNQGTHFVFIIAFNCVWYVIFTS